MVSIFLPDIPELAPVRDAAKRADGCEIRGPTAGYWEISAHQEIRFLRKEMGIGPALWNSALSGGFVGRIVEYSADVLRIVDEDHEARS